MSDFVSKQTPLSMLGGQEVPPRPEAAPGPTNAPLQVRGEGPELRMEGLMEQDPEKRRQGVAEAIRDTDMQYLQASTEAMKK